MDTPSTVSDLFPSRWLSADDLKGRSFELTIVKVTFEQVRDRFNVGQGNTTKACVWFDGAQKGLLLNKTQAMAIADITGSERFDKWPGKKIVIRAGEYRGKRTIFVERPAGQQIK